MAEIVIPISGLTILEMYHLNIKDELYECWLHHYIEPLQAMYQIVLNMLNKYSEYSSIDTETETEIGEEDFYYFIYTNTLNSDYNRKYGIKHKPLL